MWKRNRIQTAFELSVQTDFVDLFNFASITWSPALINFQRTGQWSAKKPNIAVSRLGSQKATRPDALTNDEAPNPRTAVVAGGCDSGAGVSGLWDARLARALPVVLTGAEPWPASLWAKLSSLVLVLGDIFRLISQPSCHSVLQPWSQASSVGWHKQRNGEHEAFRPHCCGRAAHACLGLPGFVRCVTCVRPLRTATLVRAGSPRSRGYRPRVRKPSWKSGSGGADTTPARWGEKGLPWRPCSWTWGKQVIFRQQGERVQMQ